MRSGLPFTEGALGAVVAHLTLHYFQRTTTRAVVAEPAEDGDEPPQRSAGPQRLLRGGRDD